MVWSPFAEFVAWWLAFVLLAFVGFGPLRRDKGAAQAYLVTVVVHIAAAAIYVYIPDVLPSRADASSFHKYAVLRQWSEGSQELAIGSRLYEEMLAKVYALFGPSYFLGSILSIYAFALSVIVLVRFMEILNIQHGKGLVVLLFGALPTAVLYGSVPMREPYQVLFFMLACYCLLRFRLTSQPLYLIAGAVFATDDGGAAQRAGRLRAFPRHRHAARPRRPPWHARGHVAARVPSSHRRRRFGGRIRDRDFSSGGSTQRDQRRSTAPEGDRKRRPRRTHQRSSRRKGPDRRTNGLRRRSQHVYASCTLHTRQ